MIYAWLWFSALTLSIQDNKWLNVTESSARKAVLGVCLLIDLINKSAFFPGWNILEAANHCKGNIILSFFTHAIHKLSHNWFSHHQWVEKRFQECIFITWLPHCPVWQFSILTLTSLKVLFSSHRLDLLSERYRILSSSFFIVSGVSLQERVIRTGTSRECAEWLGDHNLPSMPSTQWLVVNPRKEISWVFFFPHLVASLTYSEGFWALADLPHAAQMYKRMEQRVAIFEVAHTANRPIPLNNQLGKILTRHNRKELSKLEVFPRFYFYSTIIKIKQQCKNSLGISFNVALKNPRRKL